MSAVTTCISTWSTPVCTDTGQVPDGTSCGEGHVCSGGTCVEQLCEPGAICQPASPCSTGVVVCTSSMKPGGCTVTGEKPDGSPCGEHKLCWGGACVSETIDHVLARCPTAGEVQWVNDRLPYGLRFEFDPTAGELFCRETEGSADLTRFQERAYQAVLTMQRLKFDTKLPWTDDDLGTWFTSSVKGIRFRSDTTYSFCCDPVGVINIKNGDFPSNYLPLPYLITLGWGDLVYDSPLDGSGLNSLVYLLAHEARHANGIPHDCIVDGMQWDSSLAYMGAWAVRIYLGLWIADHSDPEFMAPADASPPPSYYRDSARWSANSLIPYVLCEP